MPKIYVRVNPRSQISKRHRCAIEFTGVWKELDIDDATRAALEEDPYLEVSETPTVQVEVAASTQAGAIDPYPDPFNPEINEADQNPNNPVKSQAVDGSTGDAAQGSDVTGTASPAADAVAKGAAATNGEQTANSVEQILDSRLETIKAAIAQLDPNNSDQWLSDGKPVIDAITALTGFKVLAAERDQAWAKFQAERSAG